MSSTNKKYYWLKLKNDFFDREEIKLIEAMPNGKDYIIFYMKLLLKSIENEGKLYFRGTIPYSPEMLSSITSTNIDTVRVSVDMFIKLGMMEKWNDGTMFIVETQNMIGSESRWAEYKRSEREKKEIGQCPKLSKKSPIEKDKDKEIEIEIDKESHSLHSIIALFDSERKKLQPNFIRREYRNQDAEYILRIHLKETNRTPQMFMGAIKWLFSNNSQAAFHRNYIMNIGKLIESYNTLEHQSMHSKEAVQYTEEAKMYANVLKKRGYKDEDIIKQLKEMGYIK